MGGSHLNQESESWTCHTSATPLSPLTSQGPHPGPPAAVPERVLALALSRCTHDIGAQASAAETTAVLKPLPTQTFSQEIALVTSLHETGDASSTSWPCSRLRSEWPCVSESEQDPERGLHRSRSKVLRGLSGGLGQIFLLLPAPVLALQRPRCRQCRRCCAIAFFCRFGRAFCRFGRAFCRQHVRCRRGGCHEHPPRRTTDTGRGCREQPLAGAHSRESYAGSALSAVAAESASSFWFSRTIL